MKLAGQIGVTMCAKDETIPVTGNKSRLFKGTRILLALTVAVFAGSQAATGPAAAEEKLTKAQKTAEGSYPEAVEEAARNAPPAGQASIYFLRPQSLVGSAVCFSLEVDHSTWGGLGNGQYSWAPLSPGEHSFKRTVRGEVSLNADPGKTYYVVISAGGIGTGGVKFVSPEKGEKMKSKLSLNPDLWLLRQYLANFASVRVGMTLEEVQHLLRMSEGSSVSRPEGFFFFSMLGYSLRFQNGILTSKTYRQGQGSGHDSHGCPSPAAR